MDPFHKDTSFKVKEGRSESLAKYNLRTKSIQNRIEVERRTSEPRHPKPKHKPAPLSKYRRKTANFRERCRMQVRPTIECRNLTLSEPGALIFALGLHRK